MQNCRRVVILLISLLMAGSIVAHAEDGVISVPVPIGTYDIKPTQLGQEVYVDNFGRLLVPGKPNLPSKIFAVAIPPGAEVAGVTFDVGEGIVLPGTYDIAPSRLPRVIGEENPELYARDQEMYEANFNSVYGSDEPYPASVGEVVRTAGFRKYNLVDIRITPFSYRPLSGELTYHPEATVHVAYTLREGFSSEDIVVDNLPRKEQIAQEIILNFDQARGWHPDITGAKESFDFVIITLDALTFSVAPLVDWETSKGRSVNVVTTSWINSNYAGYDLAERMRNFLRDKYPCPCAAPSRMSDMENRRPTYIMLNYPCRMISPGMPMGIICGASIQTQSIFILRSTWGESHGVMLLLFSAFVKSLLLTSKTTTRHLKRTFSFWAPFSGTTPTTQYSWKPRSTSPGCGIGL
jgi:hypothetical protein